MEATEAKWWTMVSPKRRQEIALGALVAGAVILLAALVKVFLRARARRLA